MIKCSKTQMFEVLTCDIHLPHCTTCLQKMNNALQLVIMTTSS